MSQPRIVVFVRDGSVESIHADTPLVDVKVVECRGRCYEERFDKYYQIAESEGLYEIDGEKTIVNEPWYGDEDEQIAWTTRG